MISKRTKYALKAMLALADQYEKGPVLIADLAEREGIPKKFLEQILLDLKNAGFIQSKKGKGGGYFLRRRPREIRLGQIIRMFDGPLALLPCVSQTAYQRCSECRDERTCGIRLIMKDVRDATAHILDNTSVADVQERVAEVLEADSKALSFEI
ncbi:MAG: Rrf2 family transcriptional regulator [Planctomycetota bacterium]|nr:Rrf2 family transcriptional regulator [Planctomycetota bacterium]